MLGGGVEYWERWYEVSQVELEWNSNSYRIGAMDLERLESGKEVLDGKWSSPDRPDSTIGES